MVYRFQPLLSCLGPVLHVPLARALPPVLAWQSGFALFAGARTGLVAWRVVQRQLLSVVQGVQVMHPLQVALQGLATLRQLLLLLLLALSMVPPGG